jgi:hypothetical protein
MSESAPLSEELEISVFGPGIGECVVAHLGFGDWIVVDSCIDRRSGRPVALQYLESIGVDVRQAIKLIVATHWHDDHILGLSHVLQASEQARFVNSAVYRLQQLARLVELGKSTAPLTSATNEYDNILEILADRRAVGARRKAVGPIPALANKVVLALRGPDRQFHATVHAMSPADGVFNLAQTELEHALSFAETRRRPVRLTPNQSSVVLWLEAGVHNVLLGADLEFVRRPSEGWRAIVNNTERPIGQAMCFKVPHHGSANADCPECWDSLLKPSPITVITPYGPSKLPRSSDLDRLCRRTANVYLTGDPRLYNLPRRDSTVERTLKEVVISRKAATGKMGQVCVRWRALDLDGAPVIALKNGAWHACAAA